MTLQSPRIYLYKITFEEVPYYYYGVHKERKYNEKYWGRPVTHKWCWKSYTPKKQILQLFDFTDEGWLEALDLERRVIKPFYKTDKWCLNENCGGVISLEVSRKYAKIGGQKSLELGVGVHGLTKKQNIEYGKMGAEKCKELGVGIVALTKEQLSENGKKGSKIGSKKGGQIKAEISSKEFSLRSPEGIIVNCRNIRKFCRENNLCRACIGNVILGKRKSHKGWTLP